MEAARFDYVIVGAGLYGATFAERAVAAGKKVLVIDRRDKPGGNACTESVSGIHVHRYGPHVFHTNDKEVYDYLSGFCTLNSFVHTPKAFYRGNTYSLPFTMHTFREMWGDVSESEAREIIRRQCAEIKHEPRNLEEQAIATVGRDLYETLIRGYTQKQWGRECSALPPSIIKRIPIRFTFDSSYYNARYQGIPTDGYTKMVERMLAGAEVRLGEDYFAKRDTYDSLAGKIIFTGSIDAYFGYSLGRLAYRTLTFEQEILDIDRYQTSAVVNYTDADVPWTRITEHKWFQPETADTIRGTVITREYSAEWEDGREPFYPVGDEASENLLKKYIELAKSRPNVLFGGRLGRYRYLDMDAVVRMALDDAKAELRPEKAGRQRESG
ncbi:MAG: UDP-galactopyranose mutase [Ruminococcus sp.]|nr:UDP-galactopyranose mutase [Candidatus Apopatosoma intestinale]